MAYVPPHRRISNNGRITPPASREPSFEQQLSGLYDTFSEARTSTETTHILEIIRKGSKLRQLVHGDCFTKNEYLGRHPGSGHDNDDNYYVLDKAVPGWLFKSLLSGSYPHHDSSMPPRPIDVAVSTDGVFWDIPHDRLHIAGQPEQENIVGIFVDEEGLGTEMFKPFTGEYRPPNSNLTAYAQAFIELTQK